MGSRWKIPTKTQCQELIDGTNSTWTTINGVNGRKFTSKTDSSKYIFLPAGGSWRDTDYRYQGVNGYYWSNDHISSTTAYNISISHDTISVNAAHHRLGRSVRAIQ